MILRTRSVLTATAFVALTSAASAEIVCYEADPTMRFCADDAAYYPFTDAENYLIPGEYQTADGSTDILMFSAVMENQRPQSLESLQTLIPLTLTTNSGLPASAATFYGVVPVVHDGYELSTMIYAVDMQDGTQIDYINSVYLEGDAVIQIMTIREGTLGAEPTNAHGEAHMAMLAGVDIIPFNE